MIKKIHGRANNPEKSSKTKIVEHVPCEYSVSTKWPFDNIEINYSLYDGEDSMKEFYIFIREHAANLIDFGRKEMLPLTEKELKLLQDSTVCYICKNLHKSLLKIKII